MVFSSFPLYHLDPPNWNQHNQQNSTLLPINESPTHHLISPQPPQPAVTNQPPSSGGGGGVSAASRPNSMAERARLAKIPQPEPALKCPRCDSTNTKFCYFNNYSLSQPRHFCKACRRYWTRGGALRNVPVGGGCRRNKRSSNSKPKGSSASAASSSSSSVAGGSFVIPSLPPPTFLCSLADQYNHHQGGDYGGGGGLPFPFLGGLDSGIYPTFDGESGGGGLGLGFGKAVQSTASGLISQLAAVKMEDSFPRQYMGMGMAAAAGSGGGGGDGQYLGGGGGGWPGDLSGFHPSVSGNML